MGRAARQRVESDFNAEKIAATSWNCSRARPKS